MLGYKNIINIMLLIFTAISSSVYAAEKSQNNLVIKQSIPGNGGVMISFTSRPADCTSAYKNAHAFLNSKTSGFDQLYALISAAEITGTAVKIYYTDKGNCNSLGTMLQISGIQ